MVAKVTLTEFPPLSLAFLRFALAIIFMLPFLISAKDKLKIKLEDLPRLILIGLTMTSFNITFFYEGLARSTAINASAIDLTIPILSVLAGWWFLKEKIYWINLLGVILGFIGTLVIIGIPLIFVNSSDNLLGNILLLLSDVFFVTGALISKKMLKKYSSLLITTITFLVGALSFLGPAINDYLKNPDWVFKVSVLGILGLLYITLLSSISAYFLFQWALSKVDLPKATLFQYFGPAVAATLAVPLLQERISFSFIIGTVLMVLGVYWGTLGKFEHHQLHYKHHQG